MKSPLPLHRRTRTWYGSRTAPEESPRHAATIPAEKKRRVPVLRIAELPRQVGQAPFHGRVTGLL